MKILVVGLVENEQMDRLWREGYKRGHNIVGCYSSELVVLAELNNFLPTLRSKKIEDFDLLYFWAPGKKRWDWYATANYLHKKYSMIVVNKKNLGRYNPSILEDLYVQSDSGIDFPKSAVIFSVKSVKPRTIHSWAKSYHLYIAFSVLSSPNPLAVNSKIRLGTPSTFRVPWLSFTFSQPLLSGSSILTCQATLVGFGKKWCFLLCHVRSQITFGRSSSFSQPCPAGI